MSALGERSVRIREVEGSNPFRSTKMKTTLLGGFHFGAELGIRDLSPTYYCRTTWENKKPLKPSGFKGSRWCAVQDSNL